MYRKLELRSICVAVTYLVAATSFPQLPFSLDTSFRTTLEHPIFLASTVNTILPVEDGKIIIGGQFRFPGDPYPPVSVRHGARLNSDGSLDTTFAPFAMLGGRITRWNDKIYAAMGQTVRRRTMDGYLDPTFIEMNLGPYFSASNHGAYHVFADGSLVVSGRHILSDSIRGFMGHHNFIWFTNTGYLDTTRIHRRGDALINTFAVLPDGKFIASCGLCTEQEGHPVNRIFRMHADGALDTTFQCPIDWGQARTITPLPNGRILVSGLFKASEFSSDSLHFVRLLPNGSIDPTFNNELELYRPVFGQFVYPTHTLLADGRIILHAGCTQLDGYFRNGIALLDEHGYLLHDHFNNSGCGPLIENNQYNTPGSTAGIVQAPDGMLYIWGAYNGYDDDPEQFLVSRLYPYDFTTVVPEETEAAENVLWISPNPSTGHVTFNYTTTSLTSQIELAIRDLTGRVVHRARPSGERYEWDGSSCQAGMYLVEISENGRQLMPAQKLILQ